MAAGSASRHQQFCWSCWSGPPQRSRSLRLIGIECQMGRRAPRATCMCELAPPTRSGQNSFPNRRCQRISVAHHSVASRLPLRELQHLCLDCRLAMSESESELQGADPQTTQTLYACVERSKIEWIKTVCWVLSQWERHCARSRATPYPSAGRAAARMARLDGSVDN
eukprot:359804-Chlamydomonas_euryale.AAC.9